jgi:hypothetical protein
MSDATVRPDLRYGLIVSAGTLSAVNRFDLLWPEVRQQY